VVALTGLAAALRFSTLDLQSYWSDEAVTVACFLEPGLGDALAELSGSERTPPLYYLLAWSWSQVLGVGEVGVRSLSALLGTAAVPIAYAVGARLASRRAGLVIAAIVAVHPLLVWYSQEARAYSLLVLLGALSLLFFARALERPSRRALAAWTVVAALAMATHYFAVFLVAAEAVVLVAAHRRLLVPWVAVLVAVGLALLPLLLAQASAPDDFISDIGLGRRLRDLADSFLVGEAGSPLPLVKPAIAVLLTGGVAALLIGAGDPERRGALLAGSLGAAAILVPLLLAVAGADYFNDRNVIAAFLPLALVAAVGFAVARPSGLGAAAAAVLCGLLGAVWVAVLLDSDRHRSDWRGLAEAIGPTSGTRAILVDAGIGARTLKVYRPGVRALPAGGAPVRELVVIVESGAADSPPPSFDGWRRVEAGRVQRLAFARFRSPEPVRVVPAATLPPPFGGARAKSLVELPNVDGLASEPEAGFCRGDWGEQEPALEQGRGA
jgi:4-amino-4-deoxy-L-arabinose transferase-like glycosyltransferase